MFTAVILEPTEGVEIVSDPVVHALYERPIVVRFAVFLEHIPLHSVVQEMLYVSVWYAAIFNCLF